MNVGTYLLDDAALAALRDRARQDGKVFSFASLADLAAPFDDGDRRLDAFELEQGYARIPATLLPPQLGAKASPAVERALQQAFSWLEDSFPRHLAAQVPAGFERVILGRRGPVATPAEEWMSAYVRSPRPGAKLSRLHRENEVYFALRRFGQPDRVFGPFSVDALGVPVQVSAPSRPADGVDETALLRELPSQAALRRADARGKLARPSGFAYDTFGAADDATYAKLAQRARAGLTVAQQKSLEELVGFGVLGNLSPSINADLRDQGQPSAANKATVAVLDAALAAGTPLPEGLLLFRGLSSDSLVGASRRSLTDPGYLLTSLEPSTARRFADNAARRTQERKVLLVIEVGAGVRGLVSGNQGEQEVVLPRGTPLRLLSHRREGGYELYRVRAEAPAQAE